MFDALRRSGRRRAVALLVWLAVLVPLWTQAGTEKTFVGEVVGVHDGDTLEVMHDGRAVKVRLHGIDTPETLPGRPLARWRASSRRAWCIGSRCAWWSGTWIATAA